MADQRIEEELAHLRRVTEELSDVVTRQAGEIELLTRRVRMLMQRAAEQEATGSGGVVLADERPPHY
ncbi:SlyX family protein [Tropicimonas sp. TH_r6]|uniref:SlyX family protein n=1 Tax=Tropicimonas sp. TH_r6 TaxID=3082085 RepID=UPI0029539D12|nr:SlyX family protein [Tropicimonas sp. TH_r6]MDV7141994.1 SlyX family protein [Tropicimonas sp. TH_r6]